MLKHLQTISNKNADAMFKASVPMVRGRMVQKDYATKTAVLPTSQEGLFFVTKDNYPTGLMSLEGELSDYDVRLENIAANEGVILETPIKGERYANSEYVAAGLVDGDYLSVETSGADQGKLKKSTTPTGYRYCGTYNDNGHTLAIVEIL